MEKLAVFALLIGCCHFAFVRAADAYIIGVLHDPTEVSADDLSSMLGEVEWLYSLQSYNTTFLLIPVSFQSQWTVCELINSSSLAFIAVGSCRFHRLLLKRTESYLPFPLVHVPLDSSCDPITWSEWAFVASRVYRWLPEVVAGGMEILSGNHLMIVYSPQFADIATFTTEYFSSLHTESTRVTEQDFTEKHTYHSLFLDEDASHRNGTIPILLAVPKADAELILSQNVTYARYWLVLCEDTLDVPRLPVSPVLCISPALPVQPVDIDWSSQRRLSKNDDIFHVISLAVQQLFEDSVLSPPLVRDSFCGDINVTVSSAAGQFLDHLSQHVFDEHGSLRTDHYDITMVTENGSLTAGQWNRTTGLTLTPEIAQMFSTTQLLGNATLIVGTEVAPPFVFLDNGTWKGFCIDMLNELALRMGFRYVIRRSVDNLWGGINPDGSWNGLVGMATRKEIDMAVGPISVTADREEAVDFTKPYMESAAGLMVRRFEDPVVKMFRTLMPFTTNVWLTLGGLVLAVGLVFAIVNRFSPAKATPGETDPDRWIDSMWDSAWIIYGSFMEQGAERYPRGLAGRVILGLWWVFTILITASYTASLAAFLTFNLAEIPINSIYDLAEQSDILPLVKNGTNLYDLFKKQETRTYRKIYEMMLQAPVVHSAEQSLRLVRTGPYAFMTDREQLDLLQKADCEELVLAEETFNNNGLGFFVPEGDSLLEPLSNSIIKLMEAGLINKWRRKWWSSKDVCSRELSVSSVQSLKLDTTAGPFILFTGTTVLALFVLVWERAVSKLWPLCRALVGTRPVVV